MFNLTGTIHTVVKKSTIASQVISIVSISLFSMTSLANNNKIFENIEINQRADNERAGERVDDYLGQNVGPEFWRDENQAVEKLIAACMEKRGHQYSTQSNQALSESSTDIEAFSALAANEPRRFEALYGYGIAAEIQQELQLRKSVAAATKSTTKDALLGNDKKEVMTKEYAGAVDACATAAVNKIIRPRLPPKEVHEAYRALLAQASKTHHYQTATLAFGKCLTSSELGPIKSGRDLVMEKAFSLAGVAPVAESGELRELALTEEQLKQLQAFEQQVFQVEDGCGQTSGLYDTMYGLETNLLTNLRESFPGFSGVVK